MPQNVLIASFIFVEIFIGYMLIRGNRVYKLKTKWLKMASRAAINAIFNGDFEWRRFYERLPSNNKMVYQFWRPLDSFLDENKAFELYEEIQLHD